MHRFLLPVMAIAWLVFLVGPIAFFFAPPGAPPDDQLAGVYTAFVQLLGEPPARWIFSGLWLAMNGALFWRLALSKKRYETGDPPDLAD
jgi:hypothetical protein